MSVGYEVAVFPQNETCSLAVDITGLFCNDPDNGRLERSDHVANGPGVLNKRSAKGSEAANEKEKEQQEQCKLADNPGCRPGVKQ